jgi:hypothetical protein
MKILKLVLFTLLTLAIEHECFIPAKIMSSVLFKLDGRFKNNLGKVSETLVHDEIMKRGLIQSVVKYFYDQPNGTAKINLDKMSNEYYDLRNLYFDYYGFNIF